jgi:hypothetical protein
MTAFVNMLGIFALSLLSGFSSGFLVESDIGTIHSKNESTSVQDWDTMSQNFAMCQIRAALSGPGVYNWLCDADFQPIATGAAVCDWHLGKSQID